MNDEVLTAPPQPLDRLARGLRGHINRFAHVVINVSDPDGIMLELIEHVPIPTERPPFE